LAKLQSRLAGFVFVLLLAAHGAMVLLSLYPTSEALWWVNVRFAREARPLLEAIDAIALGNSMAVLAILCGLIAFALVSSRMKRPLWPAAASHIALGAVVYTAVTSFSRVQGRVDSAGLGDWAAHAGRLDTSQYGLIALGLMLVVACFFAHVEMLRRTHGRT
jgi:hypothetical protein